MSRVANTPLSKKDAEIFIQVVDCFDKKDNKRGIQLADQILKRSPNNGQTLSMKGALLNQMGQKEEALELVKKGLQLDIRSHICWHVYGIVHKSQKNYKEAARCYHQASRLDPHNQTLLRDLSWLQAHNRDFVGFSESRDKILADKPKIRVSWIAFSISKYFLKEYKLAFDLLDKYYEICPRQTSTSKKDSKAAAQVEEISPYEDSEIVLYRVTCLLKAEKYQEAVQFIMDNLKYVQDEMAVRNYLAIAYTHLNNYTDAITRYVDLLTYFPENYEYHKGLQINLLNISDVDMKKKMYDLKLLNLPCNYFDLTYAQLNHLYEKYLKLMDSNKKFENSRTFKKIKLTLLSAMALKNDEKKTLFKEYLTTFIESSCNSAVPSLYQDLFTLIRVEKNINNEKYLLLPSAYDIISSHPFLTIYEEIVETYIQKISTSSELTPLSYLWAEFLKSYIYEWRGDLTSALDSINKCLKHTPTALDMYIRKANILKKSGDIYEASRLLVEDCFPLDLQDRYLNNKATKYLLKAGEMDRALQTIAFFTKYDVSRGENDEEEEEDENKKDDKKSKKPKAPASVDINDFVLLKKVENSLSNIQCAWFELEMAEGYVKDKQWGQALRKLQSIRKNFTTQYNDLADFHPYCMRNYAIRTYIDIFESLDLSFAHPNFQRAATEALRIYFHLSQNPEDYDGLGHLPTAERKKERSKLKKNKEKKELLFLEAAGDSKLVDVKDLFGDSLVTNRDFIADAAEWVDLLWPVIYGLNPELLGLMAEVKVRLGKFNEALICLKLALGQEVTDTIKSYAPKNPFFTSENKEYEVLESISKILYRLSLPISKKLTSTVTDENVNEFREKVFDITNLFFNNSLNGYESSIQLPTDYLSNKENIKNYLSKFLHFSLKNNFFLNFSSFIKSFLLFDESENHSVFKNFFNEQLSSSLFSLPVYRADLYWNFAKNLTHFNFDDEFITSFISKSQQKFPLFQFNSYKLEEN